MRTLFALAFVLLAPFEAVFAASPTFRSFATNDFIVTTNLSSPWTITARRFGVTNAFTNFTIINTNVYISNNYTTNITDNSLVIYTNTTVIYTNSTVTINGTNVATINPTDTLVPYRVNSNTFGDSSLVWLNGVSLQATNLATKGALTSAGAFVTSPSATYFLAAGPNTVRLTNSSHVLLASLSSAATVQLTTGSAIGARVLLFNADTNFSLTLTNSALVDDGTKSVTLAGGYWTPSQLGESIQLVYGGGGWYEEGRYNPNISPPTADDHLVIAGAFDETPGTLIDKTIAGVGIDLSIEGDADDHLHIGLSPTMIYWTNIAGVLQPVASAAGTNTFTIDPVTGWTGTGTNYFGDDGKFHGTAINTNGGNMNGSLSAPFLPYATGTDTLADSPAFRIDGLTLGTTNFSSVTITNSGTLAVDLVAYTFPSQIGGGEVLTAASVIEPAGLDPYYHAVLEWRGSSTNWITNLYVTNLYVTNLVINGTNAASINPTDGYLPVRASATSFQDSPVHILSPSLSDIILDGGIIFGPGVTNILYRNGNDLVYTNGYQYPNLLVYGSNGDPAFFGLNASLLGDAAQVSGPKGVNLGWDVAQLALYATNIAPSVPMELGSLGSPFGNLSMDGSAILYGYNPEDAVSYSRLVISHSGTNGVGDGITFDSQAIVDGGTPRDFLFQSNGVTVAKIAANSGYIGTGEKVLADNGTFTFAYPPYASTSTNIYVENIATGTNTVFTCPTDYNFVVMTVSAVTTNTSVSPLLQMFYLTNGAYYLASSQGLVTNNNTSVSVANFVLTNGWSVAFNSALPGANIYVSGFYVPQNSRRKTYWLPVTSAATNLLYTVPAGKRATTATDITFASGPKAFTSHYAGTNITFRVYYVPSGGTLTENSRVSIRSQASGISTLAYTTPFMFNEGDSIYVTSNSTDPSQFAWVDLLEADSP